MTVLRKILLAGIISITAIAPAGAQVKIGYIDREQIFKEMPEYDSANVQIERFRKELYSQLEAMQQDLTNKTTALNAEKNNISDLVRKSREDDLKNLNNRIQLFQVKASQQLNDKNNELVQPLIQKADKALKEAGKEQGVTVILEIGQMLYFDERKCINMLPFVRTKLGTKK